MPYVYSALVNKLYPLISEAITALKNADNTDAKYRDVRPLMAILMRMAVASPRIAGHLLTRRTALSSFTWRIKGTSEKRAQDLQVRLTPVIKTLLANHVQTPMFGAMCVEVDWEKGGTAFVPKVKRVYQPVELERASVIARDLNIIDSDNSTFTRTNVGSLPEERFLYDVDSSFWIGGTLRSLIFHEILRNDTLQEWANFNKKLKGIIQGTYTKDADDKDVKVAGEALKNLATNNYALTSDAIQFKLNEIASSKAGESFPVFKQVLENDIAIAILGQANTSELPAGGGSRAALQVLNLIRADIYLSDLIRMQDLINSQLLVYDYRLNEEKGATASQFSFEFVFDDNTDIETTARTVEILLRSGVALKKDEVYGRLGFTAPELNDEVIEGSQQAGIMQ